MFNIKEILKATGGKLIQGEDTAFISGISTDTRTVRPGDLFIALKGPNFDGHNFIEEAVRKGACAIVTERNTQYAIRNTNIIEVKDALCAYGDIAHFHRMRFNIPIIGVTGSNGKTTVKEMIASVSGQRFSVLKNEGTQNNLVGVPKTLLGLEAGHNIAVLEIGTNHFGEIERLTHILNPTAGVITNIGPSHLEFLESEKGVLREKSALLQGLDKDGAAILNADDKLLQAVARVKCRKITFGIDNICDFRATYINCHNDGTDFVVNGRYSFKMKLLGRHNVYNALAAITAGFLNKIEYKDIYNTLYEFESVKGRLCLKVVEGIHIMDDTYNSNPFSLEMAILALSNYQTAGRKIFICGDMLELGKTARDFHYKAGRLASEAGIDFLVSVGAYRDVVREGALAGGMRPEAVFPCRDNSAALEALKCIMKENDAVLLKGSRLMRLDEVVDALLSSIPAQGPVVRV